MPTPKVLTLTAIHCEPRAAGPEIIGSIRHSTEFETLTVWRIHFNLYHPTTYGLI
jgi:hypothetical protein